MTNPIAASDWPRLLSLVEQALDLPAADREAWLARLALPAPLTDSLRSLLDERRAIEADDFLAELPALAAADAGHAPGAFAPGASICPWRLLRELGQGGMSVVWLAERADGHIDRQVALKLPHAGPGHELLAKRLLRERSILAALEHPHIARLYEVGMTDGGTPYLVMEYVQGEELLAYADARRLGIAQRIALFQQVLRAVQYAHGKLVLHRDLKPGNILVTASGEVKLLDFGIAKLMAGEGIVREETELTRAADRRLTPSYASPEQLRGQTLGTASDVYSLGVILCELLCGQRPHASAHGSAVQLEAAVLNEEPRAPSKRKFDASAVAARATSAAALAKALCGDLDAIVLKALAKTPEQRYASADALGADLGRWMVGAPVNAQAPGAWYLARKFVQRHRFGVALGTVVAAALITATTAALLQGRSARQEADRAATARDFLLQLFEDAAPDRLRGVELTAMQLLEQGGQKAQARLGGQTRLQAELLLGIGETQYRAGDMTRAEASLAKAAELFSGIEDKAQEAAARLTRLQVAIDESNFGTVDGLMRDLLPLASTFQASRLLQVRWLLAQGRYAAFAGNPDATKTWLRKCLALATISDPREAAVAFAARLALVYAEMGTNDMAAADAELKAAQAIPAYEVELPEVEKTFALATARLALDCCVRQHIASLLSWLPASIARCDREIGKYSLKCASLKASYVKGLLLSGDVDTALPFLEQGDRWLNQTTSPEAKFNAALVLTQALALAGRTDATAAPIAALEKLVQPGAIPIAKQMPALVTLAELRLRAGDAPGALQRLAQAETLADSAGGERSKALWHIKIGRGLALQSIGKDRDALEAMSALCDASGSFVYLHLVRLNCVRSLVATGDLPKAIALVRKALPVFESSLGADAPNTVRARRLLNALEAPGGYRSPAWEASQIFLAF